MKPWQYMFIGLWIVTIILAFAIGRRPKEDHTEPSTIKVDTLYVRDTIKVTEPVYVTRRMVDSVPVPVTDTLRMRDTLYVYLEREQVRWEDSLSVVYASGIRPEVDSVIHYTGKQIITREIPMIQAKKTRWGIGVQAGYGAYLSGNVVNLTPYVGIGVSYNIIAW